MVGVFGGFCLNSKAYMCSHAWFLWWHRIPAENRDEKFQFFKSSSESELYTVSTELENTADTIHHMACFEIQTGQATVSMLSSQPGRLVLMGDQLEGPPGHGTFGAKNRVILGAPRYLVTV